EIHRGSARTKPVLLVISLAGIKVCSPDGKITTPLQKCSENPLVRNTAQPGIESGSSTLKV
ncbi:hypothetical protein L9F63_022072, partial [Diploptera punctata]